MERLGVCSSVRAELQAVLRGLTLARTQGFRRLIFSMDSQVVVQILHCQVACMAKHAGIIQRCMAIIDSPDWDVIITHTYREANQVADILANLGVGMDCAFMYFSNPPREVLSALYADKVGTRSPRLIANQ